MIAPVKDETTEMWRLRRWANDGEKFGAVKDARELLKAVFDRATETGEVTSAVILAAHILRVGKDENDGNTNGS